LLSVDKDSITLNVEVIVEVASKQFRSEPQIIKQGFHGEIICEDMKIKEPKAGQVTIEGQKIPCKILQLECPGPTNKTVTNVYYSPKVAPYVLKRESVTSDREGKNVLSTTTSEVVALDMPCKVGAEIKSSAVVWVVCKHPKGTITTQAITSTAVPGGIVSHWSKELGKNCRVVRRSTQELVEYGLVADEQRTGLFGGKRRSRLRKPSIRNFPW
jgi:ribosomal protein L36